MNYLAVSETSLDYARRWNLASGGIETASRSQTFMSKSYQCKNNLKELKWSQIYTFLYQCGTIIIGSSVVSSHGTRQCGLGDGRVQWERAFFRKPLAGKSLSEIIFCEIDNVRETSRQYKTHGDCPKG